ncbi:hypothetical protein NKR19_g8673 [Coniochaeta hoffmannii]|uniref:DUF7730 domain-containing protein n=1 Tax=Coniochaeta hoffmannii TaxID=91930 RepID=A0AA38RL21_9PEZI|nr:hypothetical protein NKR19_g8673 [Coniochaeta hoffmannii]
MNTNTNLANRLHVFAGCFRRPRHHEPPLGPAEQPANARHALETLPSLPSPLPTITPVPPNPQSQSPIFELPPELRLQIYRLLLSDRELHIDMRHTAWETTTPHSTAGAHTLPTRRWRWRASTCHRHPDAPVTSDKCGWGGPPPTTCDAYSTPCGIGKEALSLLLACRSLYLEAVDVLYAENTFHISTGALLLFTPRLLSPTRSSSIASLVYTVTPESVLTYAGEHLGLEPGLPAYRALISRIPVAFPGLRSLQIAISDPALVRNLCSLSRSVWVEETTEDARLQCWDLLLAPVDAVVVAAAAAFGDRLREFVVVVGHRVAELLPDLRLPDRREAVEGRYEQAWRSVPAHGTDEAGVHGYWVRMVCRSEGDETQVEASFRRLMTEMEAFSQAVAEVGVLQGEVTQTAAIH